MPRVHTTWREGTAIKLDVQGGGPCRDLAGEAKPDCDATDVDLICELATQQKERIKNERLPSSNKCPALVPIF